MLVSHVNSKRYASDKINQPKRSMKVQWMTKFHFFHFCYLFKKFYIYFTNKKIAKRATFQPRGAKHFRKEEWGKERQSETGANGAKRVCIMFLSEIFTHLPNLFQKTSCAGARFAFLLAGTVYAYGIKQKRNKTGTYGNKIASTLQLHSFHIFVNYAAISIEKYKTSTFNLNPIDKSLFDTCFTFTQSFNS